MPPNSRILRAVGEALSGMTPERPPVDVRKVAQQYAYVQLDTLPKDVSGVLMPGNSGASKRWVILVNRVHSPARRRFTIAHELGHIMLHQYATPHADGLARVYFRNDASSRGTNREEVEANQFAAELLMPADLMVPRLRRLGLDSWNTDSDTLSVQEKITGLAREFDVSLEAMLLRIGALMQR